jgi:hypothetical protein
MKYLFMILLFLPGCAMLRDLESAADKIEAGLARSQEALSMAQAKWEHVKTAADVDESGDVSNQEWIYYLLGLVGLGGVGKLISRNTKSDERKARLEERVGTIEKSIE